MARTKQTARKPFRGTLRPDIQIKNRKKQQLSNQQLRSWLKLNRLILDDNTTNEILKQSLNDIIQSLGSIKDMFLFLANTAKCDNNKLELIQQSISKQIIKHQNNNKIKEKDDNDINDDINDKKKNENVFEIIPNECISHICGYLEKQNIKSFKLTSRRTGIVGLDEMNKICIGTLTGNSLINNNEFSNLYGVDPQQMTIWNRYPSSKRYHSLYADWYKQYNIPQQNQLIFLLCDGKNVLIDSESMEMNKIEHKKQYLILDNRKVTILSDQKLGRKFDIELDKYEVVRDHELMILEYFDINKQITNIAQFILYEGSICRQRLFEYIQHEFIPIDIIDNKWYHELQHDLKQMCHDEKHQKLCIYQHKKMNHSKRRGKRVTPNKINLVDTTIIECGNFNSRLFTFQLNSIKHSWFKNINKFDEIKLKCKEEMDSFYVCADKFYQDTIYIAMRFKGDRVLLESVVKHHYNLKVSKLNDTKMDLEGILRNIEKQCIKIKMSKISPSNILRHKISMQLFNNIIDPQYIELFDIDHLDFRRIKWNTAIGAIGTVYYSVVLYDTQSF